MAVELADWVEECEVVAATKQVCESGLFVVIQQIIHCSDCTP